MSGPNPVGTVTGDCYIRIAGVGDNHLLHTNDTPFAVAHCIEAAPRYAARVFETFPVRVIVEVNGRVVYSHTPSGTPRWAQGVTIEQRLKRRTLREAKARALAALQGAVERGEVAHP